MQGIKKVVKIAGCDTELNDRQWNQAVEIGRRCGCRHCFCCRAHAMQQAADNQAQPFISAAGSAR